MKHVIPVTLIQIKRASTPTTFTRMALIPIAKIDTIEEIHDDDSADLTEYKAGARTRIETDEVVYTVEENIVAIYNLIEQ